MKNLKEIASMVVFVLAMNIANAQSESNNTRAYRDPKLMTERLSQKLNFSDDQKSKLISLNDKYKGDGYDKMKYREEFRSILTEAQKQQLDEMKRQRAAEKDEKTSDQ